jgi:hypothetical protein
VRERVARRRFFVENDVGDSFHSFVAGYCDGRSSQVVFDRHVGRDEAFDATSQQHLRICLQHSLIVAVNYGEEKIIVPAQVFFHPADDHGPVRIAYFLSNYAYCVGALQAQRAREVIGAIVQLTRRGYDAFLGVLRDGSRSS